MNCGFATVERSQPSNNCWAHAFEVRVYRMTIMHDTQPKERLTGTTPASKMFTRRVQQPTTIRSFFYHDVSVQYYSSCY